MKVIDFIAYIGIEVFLFGFARFMFWLSTSNFKCNKIIGKKKYTKTEKIIGTYYFNIYQHNILYKLLYLSFIILFSVSIIFLFISYFSQSETIIDIYKKIGVLLSYLIFILIFVNWGMSIIKKYFRS